MRATQKKVAMAILRPGALRRCVLTIALSFVAGCTSTQIVNQWSDPNYTPSSLRKIVVLGISTQIALRRSFEDEFVAQLRSSGIQAVPSYQVIPEEGQAPEQRLLSAVKRTGADAAIMTRLVRVERRKQITPGYYNPYPGLYGWYASGWAGFYEPPRVYHYDVYTSETSLYDLARDRLVWAGTVQTTDPGDIPKEIKNYVKTVIEALKEKHLLRSAPQ
jgi:Domain of unknown function (DUF4136)